LDSRFRRLQLTRAGFVARHFGVEKLHPKKLILADLEKGLDLLDSQAQIDGLHTLFYH
jgi:hypothetical protein